MTSRRTTDLFAVDRKELLAPRVRCTFPALVPPPVRTTERYRLELRIAEKVDELYLGADQPALRVHTGKWWRK